MLRPAPAVTSRGDRWLRSSPTLEGRCCRWAASRQRTRVKWRCDPHRPWRAGAAASRSAVMRACSSGGCDPHRPWRAGAAPAVEVVRYRPTKEVATARPSGCDPHRPWRAGAAGKCTGTRSPRVMGLRSSPTLEGRCCPGATRNHAGHPLVAILTDPGGPVLPADSCRPRTARSRCCDPHRPWRAGAARMGGTRARAVVQGCDPHRPWRAGAARKIRIEVVDERYVAILTDPGGPVLLAMDDATKAYLDELRSSPTLEGRCCTRHGSNEAREPHRCCDPHRPWRAGAARQRLRRRDVRLAVAILTDPGGPVLPSPQSRDHGLDEVAILTDPGGPVLLPTIADVRAVESELRSSPTLEGRCCPPLLSLHAVEHLRLRSSPTLEGRCCCPAVFQSCRLDRVAILTDPGGPVLHEVPEMRVDPLQPGVAILTDPGGPVLPAR